MLSVDAWFYIYFAIGAVGVFLIGYGIAKKTQKQDSGFSFILLMSVVLFAALTYWFNGAAREVLMGTLPWLINLIFGGVLLIVFLTGSKMIFKRI
ncbi:hypothetical protein [Exiguobacterium undae]|uniref:Uncharacterized protein n=1 Tax=Exiguobacterium undae TaxID=169177 RepID=A0ABX2VBW1_9BACL|nr:hypothetical protein [Exiguobacterium undae]OAN15636.1 hypothetical protein A3783_06780 [Exiguobacterium undae]